MEYVYLVEHAQIKTISEDAKRGVFELEGLYAGYGLTVGNALRRVLFSSLPGAAVTSIKIKGASHEFSTLPGIKENLVDLTLNFKNVKFRLYSDEQQILSLKAKGEGVVRAGDIKVNSQIAVVNPEEVLATLTSKDAELDAEITVDKGLGYSPVELRKKEKLAVGAIGIDAFFSPVTKVNYSVENMRVGDRTDYNRLRLEIETDGTISPSAALRKSANILKDHFEKAAAVEIKEFESSGEVEATREKIKKRGRPKKA